jgi:hypothetical protein
LRAGLTPAQALVAATQTSAKVMRLDADRGTIAPGKRADILLIDGKPWENIADIHKITQVYIDGRLVSGVGAPPLPAANLANRLPSVKVGRWWMISSARIAAPRLILCVWKPAMAAWTAPSRLPRPSRVMVADRRCCYRPKWR